MKRRDKGRQEKTVWLIMLVIANYELLLLVCGLGQLLALCSSDISHFFHSFSPLKSSPAKSWPLFGPILD